MVTCLVRESYCMEVTDAYTLLLESGFQFKLIDNIPQIEHCFHCLIYCLKIV